MIVKFFKRGGVTDNKFSTGGESAKNYLLNERVQQGTAQLLKGDPEETTEIINGLGFSKIFTSGCLSFDSEESKKIDDELKQKLMNMGFTKGCKLYVLQGLTKGSIMVKVRDSKVVLNASTAHKIQCS